MRRLIKTAFIALALLFATAAVTPSVEANPIPINPCPANQTLSCHWVGNGGIVVLWCSCVPATNQN